MCGNQICREVKNSFGKCEAFPKLRILGIEGLPMLEELPVLEGGSMPCLEELRLIHCNKVGRVPDGLDELKSLKVFDFSGSGTDECKERLKEEGEEWKRKMKANNPRVQIYIWSNIGCGRKSQLDYCDKAFHFVKSLLLELSFSQNFKCPFLLFGNRSSLLILYY